MKTYDEIKKVILQIKTLESSIDDLCSMIHAVENRGKYFHTPKVKKRLVWGYDYSYSLDEKTQWSLIEAARELIKKKRIEIENLKKELTK